MARGRMISKSLSTSERFANLFEVAGDLAEFCQSLYPLIVSHSDDFGRLQGDPHTVKLTCHPSSPRSKSDFARALQILHDAELLIWYDHVGRKYLQVVQFDKHQEGLKKRTKSKLPEPPGNSCRFQESPDDSGNLPEIPDQENRTEEKRTQSTHTARSVMEDTLTDDDTADRAAWLIQRFGELFHQERNGAFYMGRPAHDYPAAIRVAATWKDRGYIEQMVICFLNSDDPFIKKSPLNIPTFASRASWCDDRLRSAMRGSRAS